MRRLVMRAYSRALFRDKCALPRNNSPLRDYSRERRYISTGLPIYSTGLPDCSRDFIANSRGHDGTSRGMRGTTSRKSEQGASPVEQARNSREQLPSTELLARIPAPPTGFRRLLSNSLRLLGVFMRLLAWFPILLDVITGLLRLSVPEQAQGARERPWLRRNNSSAFRNRRVVPRPSLVYGRTRQRQP